MDCGKCGAANKAGRRFCAKCGAPLELNCATCGFANEAGDEFCGGCGGALNAAPAAAPAAAGSIPSAVEPQPAGDPLSAADPVPVAGERRQVTILFADLAGFTKLSSERDPEETHRILSRFFETVDGIVDSFGGSIDKHMGDSVMALFGAPIAHGNDPERAVGAALAIHDAMAGLSGEMNLTLKIHAGVASGQVMASGLGSQNHSEYTVLGDSVNLAARLMGRAGEGETLISPAVQSALPRGAELEDLGETEVRGLEQPVRLWRVLGLGDGDAVGDAPLFVGRRAELRQFHGVLESLAESATGQVVYLRGEGGIGKSRLVDRFAALAAERGLSSHRGLILDFGVGRGREPIADLMRELLGLVAESDGETRSAAVEQAITEGLIDAGERIFLYDLMNIPQSTEMRAVYDAMDNENRNLRKQECVAALFAGAARTRPLLLIIEDVHWAHGRTTDHLARLARLAGEHPIILLMSSRIEGDPLDSTWRYSAGASPFTTIDLMPLRIEEAMQIAEEFVDVNKAFAAQCVARAEGNPLFLDQLLRSTIGQDQEAVPGSVQSIVLARVDLLSPEDKRALQAAAVLGQLFSLDVLRHLLEAPGYDCAALVKNHLVRAAGEDFLFAHALIWESVYASLLHSHRSELHLVAAEWFAGRDLNLQAEHFGRAGDDRAPAAYLEAAREKSRCFHFESALEMVESGHALASAAADSHQLLMLKGECTREMGHAAESTAIYRAALDVAEDGPARCRALIGLAAGMRVTDDFDAAFEALDQAQAIAESEALNLERSQVHYYRGNLYCPLGEIEGCLKEHEQALAQAQLAASPEDEARALSGLGDAYYSRGRMITALDYFRRCIDLCHQHGYGRIAVGNQYMVAWGRFYLNETAAALEDALDAIASAERIGHQRAEMVARLTAARILVESGDTAAAEPHVERGLELAESLGASRFKPFLLIYIARIRFAQGAAAGESVDLMRQALDLARQTGTGFLAPWVLGTLALVSDEPAAAVEALREGEELLAEGCVGHNYYAFYRSAIEVALRLEDWREAGRYADALTAYAAEEPLPWSEFLSARGHALAAFGRGERSAAITLELERLRDVAEQAGLRAPLVAIQQALGAA